jgi:hypothetical protein
MHITKKTSTKLVELVVPPVPKAFGRTMDSILYVGIKKTSTKLVEVVVLPGSESFRKNHGHHHVCWHKKTSTKLVEVVVPPGIEPGTPGFSVLCSTY